ncbi:hypothetical protein [Streptomyces sp. NRRL F-5053]|uniref:hypothetical protein n=1 Tax=Streptomyces sp. NRRL F-5053 TaxID=1463854 RepID=UPI0006896BDA|nr:hypothetical protein [Streptomyces sp. NRRL F-5053]
MAQLKGKGAMRGVNLIARVYTNAVTKDGAAHYADVQIDARDPRGPGQRNLHLKSERIATDDGKTRYNQSARYSADQMNTIIKAAGSNTVPITDRNGDPVGMLYGFKADVMPPSRGTGLVVNTKTVEASEFEIDNTTMKNQYDSMRAAHIETEAARSRTPPAEQSATATQSTESEAEQLTFG